MNFHSNSAAPPKDSRPYVRRTGLRDVSLQEEHPAAGVGKRLYFVDQGPECLFVSIKDGCALNDDFQGLCEELWTILQRHLVKRLFLDLTNVDCLSSLLIGQLISLKIRLEKQDGMLCLCGLSTRNQHVLEIHNLQNRLPCYASRHDAVMGDASY